MPDVISFQKELKNGTVKLAHELEKSASKGKARADGESSAAKGKKRPSMGSGDEAEAEMPDKKKRKAAETGWAAKVKRKGADAKKSISEPSEEPESQETGARRKSSAATANNSTRPEAKSVRVLTTQLHLGDDVIKALTKLGVKFVTKPTECTHLLVRSVVRTEKFLCAMAVAPYVLSEKWAISSATVRKLMPEHQFMVEDPETEKKYGFRLADALERAKENAGKLFAGKTFYVTPKVPVDSKLLKHVVTANGGQFLSTQTPTVRMLSGHDDRLVISCPADVSIWRPLVEHGHPVYTQELILTSALRQELDLEDPGFLDGVSSSMIGFQRFVGRLSMLYKPSRCQCGSCGYDTLLRQPIYRMLVSQYAQPFMSPQTLHDFPFKPARIPSNKVEGFTIHERSTPTTIGYIAMSNKNPDKHFLLWFNSDDLRKEGDRDRAGEGDCGLEEAPALVGTPWIVGARLYNAFFYPISSLPSLSLVVSINLQSAQIQERQSCSPRFAQAWTATLAASGFA
ncbi:hypothetical protein NUW54_g11319 [Trametes sanguinea]|uniref:Uncharacterized protein n=1 Tax=Trametes sanguinea TaxID=158606 RepID=A0ACC1NGP3_9APHY|nr:hypothetical protein NUW54_g11319 [Trametes sanguinea]